MYRLIIKFIFWCFDKLEEWTGRLLKPIFDEPKRQTPEPTVTIAKPKPQPALIPGRVISAIAPTITTSPSGPLTNRSGTGNILLNVGGSYNTSGGYSLWGKPKVFVLCANQFSFDTFKALGDLEKDTDYTFVEKLEDIKDDEDGQLLILNDFPLNPNIESILEVLSKRLTLTRKLKI
ncbi:MAG: hypothetical protein Q8Q89_00905 [bacterium]|nr:hypothetical protein [bacterium]